MSVDREAERWLRKEVKAYYGTGGIRCEGEVVAYCEAPTVTIRKSDGTLETWRADMCEVVEGRASDDEVEKIYEDFWKPLVEEDGEVDIEQVKKELHDFYLLMGNASVVYEEVTGGILNKSTYTAETVLSQYRARLEDERRICRECGEEVRG